MKYTKAERIEIAQKVADLYLSGMYSFESCCKAVKVRYDTFRNWAAPSLDDYNSLTPAKQTELIRRGFVPEVHSLIKETKQIKEVIYTDLVLDKAYVALLKLIEGYYYNTKVTIKKIDRAGKMRITGYRIRKKYVPPNVHAVIFVLKKLDPAFKDVPEKIKSAHDKEREIIRAMSDDELFARVVQLQAELADLDNDTQNGK